jgi:hypothetical protein
MIDRKKEWSTVAKKLKESFDIEVKLHKYLKSYYLTGTVDCEKLSFDLWGQEVDPEKPFEYMDAPVLLECWLSIDESWNHWVGVRAG